MNHTEMRVVTGPANYFSTCRKPPRDDELFTPEQLFPPFGCTANARLPLRPALPAGSVWCDAGAKHLRFTPAIWRRRHVAQLAHACNDDRPEVVARRWRRHFRPPPKRSPAVWRCRLSLSRPSRQPAPLDTTFRLWYNDAGRALQFEIFDDTIFWCWSNRAAFSRSAR